MNGQMTRAFLSGLACSMLAGSALAQQAIEHVAPDSSFLIIGTKSAEATEQSFRNSTFWQMWESDHMQEHADEIKAQWDQTLDQMLEELGIDRENIVLPQGALGFAMFMAMDEDFGIEMPGMMVLADYGENADQADQLLKAMLDKVEEEGQEYDENEIAGRTVYTIDTQPDQAEEDWEGQGDMMMPMGGAVVPNFEEVHVSRSENHFLICTDLDVLRSGFEHIDGEEAGALNANDDFRGALGQIGNGDVYGVVLPRNMGEAFAGPMMMMMPMAEDVLEMLGLSALRAVAFGMNFNTPGSAMESTMSMYIPEGKNGLFALADSQTTPGTLPKFIGPDIMSYNRFNFEFSGLMALIRDVVAGLPEEYQADAEQIMFDAGPIMERIFNAVGPDIHMYTGKGLGIGGEPGTPTIALRCTNQESVETVLAMFGPQIMLEPREFLGQMIYSDPDDMFAIGFGGGYAIVGGGGSVEQALRATGGGEVASLARVERFQRAMVDLGTDDVVAWGYEDTINSIAEQFKMMNQQMGLEGTPLEGFEKMLIDTEWLAEYLGPGYWTVKSTRDGFVMKSRLLNAN